MLYVMAGAYGGAPRGVVRQGSLTDFVDGDSTLLTECEDNQSSQTLNVALIYRKVKA